jgi:hypothetical protein
MDGTRSDVALAYALTEVGLLVEDPALTALAPRLGFDRPIDASLLWGADGILDRLSRHASCDSITQLVHDRFPHPSARPMGPDFWSTLDSTLTLGDVRSTLIALSPRLHHIAGALEVAARGMGADGVTLSGGCGIGSTPTRVQAPELLALAAALEAIRGAAQLTLAYDGAMPARLLFSPSSTQQQAQVDALNQHMLRVTDAAQAEAARAILVESMSLAAEAIDAARAIHTPRTDAIFDWTSLPARVLDDSTAFVTAAQAGLAADGTTATTIPHFGPTPLGIRIGSFFADPYDMGTMGPLWSLQTDTFGDYVRFESATWQAGFASRFDTDPWSISAPSRSFDVDWSFPGVSPSPLSTTFDPAARWSSGFSCTSTTTPAP